MVAQRLARRAHRAAPPGRLPRRRGRDQRLYGAHWRERLLGHPEAYPERYEASLLREAPRLTRPLLLVHGLADPRVPPAHAHRLSDVLLASGRPHQVLLLPGAGHQPIGTDVTRDLPRHQARFLRRHLAAMPPQDPGPSHPRSPA
ncbi:alpha/beta hydrolase family protein [Streptomyces sp. NPDC003233]